MSGLPFAPKPGIIVTCDYTTGFKKPEMIKPRLAVTISPVMKHRQDLVTVVPLSMTEPDELLDWHIQIDNDVPHWGPGPRWAKCDMMATLGLWRMNLPHTNPAGGKRKYHQLSVGPEKVAALRMGVAAAIGLVIVT
jgi:mRNA interferase MazF